MTHIATKMTRAAVYHKTEFTAFREFLRNPWRNPYTHARVTPEQQAALVAHFQKRGWTCAVRVHDAPPIPSHEHMVSCAEEMAKGG